MRDKASLVSRKVRFWTVVALHNSYGHPKSGDRDWICQIVRQKAYNFFTEVGVLLCPTL